MFQPNHSRPALVGAFLSVLACAALTSCGGGGGDSTAAAPTTPAPGPQQPGSPTPPPPPPPAQATATCGLPNFTTTMLARVNQWRASGANCGTEGNFGPAPAVAWNDSLTNAAAAHSQDMVDHNLFSHTGSNGSTLGQRVTAAGYTWQAVGENIAAGQTTINSVVDGWIASPGHCANIMNPAYVHVGVACINGTSSDTYPTYWTMDLGAPM